MESFIFSNVEENELEIILDAIEERKVNENDIIIRQDDSGNCLYIVESGELICTKIFVTSFKIYRKEKIVQSF